MKNIEEFLDTWYSVKGIKSIYDMDGNYYVANDYQYYLGLSPADIVITFLLRADSEIIWNVQLPLFKINKITIF